MCACCYTGLRGAHTLLPLDCENWEKDIFDTIDPPEEISDSDTTAAVGRSPEHPRTRSEDGMLDIGAL